MSLILAERRGCVARLIAAGVACAACLLLPEASHAQSRRGFTQVIRVNAGGTERSRQPDLWVLEVHLKPMRMVWVDSVNPETGEARRDQVWYLVYKAINRPIESAVNPETQPANELDPVPEPPKFIPELTLITYDDPATEIPAQTAMDEVLPQAVAAINRVEAHRPDDPVLKDTVSIIRNLMPPVAPGSEQEADAEQWLYGVATWRNIDPETDYFKVILSGFSNGYETRAGPEGAAKWSKVVEQKFIRRGDRFDPTQIEFLFDGPGRWVYQPGDGAGRVPDGPETVPAAASE